MRKAWLILGATGLVGALALSGCVVGDGDDDDTGGSGGTTATGGSGGSTGGTGGSTGGTGGSTGGTAGASGTGGTAGAAGTGGSGGFVCENVDPSPGTNSLTCTDTENNTCQKCIETKCCAEFEACWTVNPNNPCAYGGPTAGGSVGGEALCMQDRILNGASITEAAGQCTSEGCGTIDPTTSDLLGCMDQNCLVECLTP